MASDSQAPSTKQDIETGVKAEKSTSTPEMMYLFFLSTAAAIVQSVALLGWLTAKYSPADEINDQLNEISGGQVNIDGLNTEVGFIGLDPPITTIVFFAALFVIPTAVTTPLSMFTHWKPDAVLFGSQQVTDTLRGQFAAPFRMKYLYGIQVVINGTAFLSLKYAFFWPLALNIINIVLYLAGLALVFKHFQNPNVPTDLATTAASMMGGSAAASRIDSLEQEVKNLKQEVEALKNQMVAVQAPAK
jgi:cell division protein FtsL